MLLGRAAHHGAGSRFGNGLSAAVAEKLLYDRRVVLETLARPGAPTLDAPAKKLTVR
jgi:hypothetical protein